jgi:hypothetical protein
MDLTVNSQVQSPLVRTLSTIPSKASSFTYNIADNIPPISFTRVEVSASSGTKFGDSFQFRVPQYGYLQECYLKISHNVKFTIRVPSFANYTYRQEMALLPASVAKTIRLSTHNKPIQMLHGKEIVSRVLRMKKDERLSWLTAMRGVDTTNWHDHAHYNAVDEDYPTCHFLPLPFASTVAPHVNYSTRFVEDLDIIVESQPLTVDNFWGKGAGSTHGTANTHCVVASTNESIKLVCIFRNFHDVTEAAIRNVNYQKGVPASVLQYDTHVENAVNWTLGSAQTVTVPIHSNNYCYGFTIQLNKALPTDSDTGGTLDFGDTFIHPSSVQLWGSGQKLWETTLFELSCPIKRDFNLSTRAEHEQGYHIGDHYVAGPGPIYANLVKSNFAYLRLGLQHNELINSGGIALQTINTPELRFIWTTPTDFAGTIQIYTHHHNMIRIDPDNGVITRSLDV